MLRPGQAIALCVLALLMLGVVMVNSAGMSVDPSRAVTIESILLSRSTVYMALAVIAMMAVGLLPVRRLATWVERDRGGTATLNDGAKERGGVTGWVSGLCDLWPLWAGVGALLGVLACVYLPGIGREVNFSRRWVNLHVPGLESVQPSEIAKWGLILLIAWYGCRNMRRMGSFWHGLIPGLASAGIVSAVIVIEDLGTGALVGVVATIMLIAAGVKLWQLLILAPIPLAGLALAVISNPYRIHRITSFLNPYEDAQGKGYHMIQSMVAVANGQFFGRGLGHGLQKFGYLPEDTTDFLFAIICEELGVFGAALVVFLYAALLWCVVSVVRREPSRFLRLVALGVMATVGLQAVINLAVVTGLGPTKGIALPLLSSGGTGWILTAASLGLVIAMDRSQNAMQWYRVPERGEDEPDDTPVVEVAPAVSMPASDDSRFAPPVVTAMVEPTPMADVPVTMSTPTSDDVAVGETGMLFAADQPEPEVKTAPEVVVTDEARQWPDTLRANPA